MRNGSAASDLATAHSWLFVPALRATDWIPKAAAAGADVVIVDLEDGTAAHQKDAAREVVRGLRFEPKRSYRVVVRVNRGERSAQDAAAAADAAADAIMVPKVESPDDLGVARSVGLPAVALVETALGIVRATSLASSAQEVAAIWSCSTHAPSSCSRRPSHTSQRSALPGRTFRTSMG